VTIEGDGINETVKASFDVAEQASTPEVGEAVPPSDTPTADEVGDLSEISTDESPDPRYYRTSIEEAVKANEPFVAIFATPKYCQTQVCGPMLSIVQNVAKRFPKTTFIHVEPYELPAQPPKFKPVPVTEEWGLPSEPWTFVVDERGRLVSKYEGALAPQELETDVRKL
jgi:hypothetical protein